MLDILKFEWIFYLICEVRRLLEESLWKFAKLTPHGILFKRPYALQVIRQHTHTYLLPHTFLSSPARYFFLSCYITNRIRDIKTHILACLQRPRLHGHVQSRK